MSREKGYHSSGREIARLIGVTPPTAHSSLKELYAYHILDYEISGRNHLYSLNNDNRIVTDILSPIFQKEQAFKKDVFAFIKNVIKQKKIAKNIVSVLLYGSQQNEQANEISDVDIAIIVHHTKNVKIVEDVFFSKIISSFYEYFGVSLDVYIKTEQDFIHRLKKNLPPVSTLIKSYSVICGKDPLTWK